MSHIVIDISLCENDIPCHSLSIIKWLFIHEAYNTAHGWFVFELRILDIIIFVLFCYLMSLIHPNLYVSRKYTLDKTAG
jgi:hypothetical protein